MCSSDLSHALIRQHQPPLLRNSSGYMLRGILMDGRLDVPRLLAGSEGTLALFTEATLHTMALPEHRSAALLLFASLDQAILATQRILPMDPSACDLLDRRLLSLGRQADPRFHQMISPEAEAGLVVEFTSSSARDATQRLQDMQLLLRSEQIDFRCSRTAIDFDEVEFLWRLPSQVVSMLAGIRGDQRPLPFVEDLAVPPGAAHGARDARPPGYGRRAIRRPGDSVSLHASLHAGRDLPFADGRGLGEKPAERRAAPSRPAARRSPEIGRAHV